MFQSYVGSLFLFTKFSGTSLCINTSRECVRRTGIKADLALQSYHKVLAGGSESVVGRFALKYQGRGDNCLAVEQDLEEPFADVAGFLRCV